MDFWQLLLSGSIAGFTIFLGLPVAALQHLSPKKKGFLNAFAIGILVFLIIDVLAMLGSLHLQLQVMRLRVKHLLKVLHSIFLPCSADSQ